MTVTVQRTISMGHRLPSYQGICSSLHGHNVRTVVTVRCTEGFLDFKHIDGWLENVLSDLDHAMVLYEQDPMVHVLHTALPGDFLQRLVLLTVEPTTEALAQLVFNEMSSYCFVEEVVVHETDKYQASCTRIDDEVRRV